MKKTWKQTVAFLLVAAILFGLAPATVRAEELPGDTVTETEAEAGDVSETSDTDPEVDNVPTAETTVPSDDISQSDDTAPSDDIPQEEPAEDEEPIIQIKEELSDLQSVPAMNEGTDDEDIVWNRTQFNAWYERIKEDAKDADHLIAYDSGDIHTQYYTVVLPGETIAVLPYVGMPGTYKSGHANFTFTIWQFEDVNFITQEWGNNYMPHHSEAAETAELTELKTETLHIPYGLVSEDSNGVDGILRIEGERSVTYVSLYRNDTGYPLVFDKSDIWKDSKSRGGNGYDGGYHSQGNGDGGLRLQGGGSVKYKPNVRMIENEYEIRYPEDAAFAKTAGDPERYDAKSALYWPDKTIPLPTKYSITDQTQTIVLPNPILPGACLYAWYEDNRNFVRGINEIGREYVDDYYHIKEKRELETTTLTLNTVRFIEKRGLSVICKGIDIYPYYQKSSSYYTVAFHTEGGTIKGKSMIYAEAGYGRDFALADYMPVREGCSFLGWYTDPSDPYESMVDASDDVKNWKTGDNTDLYALWDRPDFVSVQFKTTDPAQGNKVQQIATRRMEPGIAYGTLPTRTMTGYTLDGWYTQPTGGTKVSATDQVPAGGITLYSRWIANTHTVTFNTGVSGLTTSPASKTVTYGSAYGELPTPSRTGYTFLGWFTSSYNGTKVTAETKVNTDNNHYIYAHWEAVTVTLTLIDRVQGTTIKKQVKYKTTYRSMISPVVKEGYKFLGYFTEEEGGKQIIDSDGDLMSYNSFYPAEDMTLYAQYEASFYTVTFDANGGTVAVADGEPAETATKKLVIYAASYGELPVPERAGYNFLGWYTGAETGTKVSAQTKPVTAADHTLYAWWGKEYTTKAPAATPGVPYDAEDADTIIEIAKGSRIALKSVSLNDVVYYKTYKTVAEAVADTASFFDGATGKPAEDVLRYTDPIAITENAQAVKAVAYNAEETPSDPVIFAYKFKDTSNDWGDDENGITEEDRTATDADGNLLFNNADDVPDELWIAGFEDSMEYNGTALTQSGMHVYYGKKRLREGVDYTVKYKNNKNAYVLTPGEPGYKASKAPTVTITGKGNYTGTITQTFAITPVNLEDAFESEALTAPDILLFYNKKVQKGTTPVRYTVDGRTLTLKAGTDFTYFYPHTNSKSKDPDDVYDKDAFKTAGDYAIQITGKGNYTGAITIREQITEAKSVAKLTVAKIKDHPYQNGSEITLTSNELIVKDGKTPLTMGVDYTVTYANNTAVGTATVTITGTGDEETGEGYVGTKAVTFKITGIPITSMVPKDLTKATNGGELFSHLYDTKTKSYICVYPILLAGTPSSGNARQALWDNGVKLTDSNGNVLRNGIDYTVTYTNNAKPGTATVTFTGIGGYTGTVKRTFKLRAFNLATDTSRGTIVIQYGKDGSPVVWGTDQDSVPELLYEKGGSRPVPTAELTDCMYPISYVDEYGYLTNVTYNGTTLQEGVDYTVTYSNNDKAAPFDATNKGKSVAPTVTITGKGRFTGKITRTFTVKERDLSEMTATATDVVYQNKAGICKTSVTLTDTNGKNLAAGKDYEKTFTYNYVKDTTVKTAQKSGKKTVYVDTFRAEGAAVAKSDIIPAGAEIRVTIKGKGSYAGSETTAIFRFVGASIAKASVSVRQQTWEGGPVTLSKDNNDITVKIGKNVLEKTDYEIVSYTNNDRKGTATVTIRGVGNYGGTKTVKFTIKAKKLFLQ